MKKTILILLIFAVFALSMSCDLFQEDADPEVRAYLDDGYNPIYFALGEVTSSGYTKETSWEYVAEGSYSDYVTVDEGTYHILYDTDSDHSTVSYFTTTVSVKVNEKYNANFLSTGFEFEKK